MALKAAQGALPHRKDLQMNITRALTILTVMVTGVLAQAADLSADKIGEIMGVKATTTKDDVVRVSWPRTDINVEVDGVALRPFAGLGTWAAFQATEHGAMVMGDTVVFQDEVNPAMDAAFANGLEVTALHNHFFFDEPKVYFMHIGGTGDPEKLAKGVKAVWDAVKTIRADNSQPAKRFDSHVPKSGSLDAEALAKILETKAETQDGIAKFTIGREAAMHGAKFGGSMGLNWRSSTGTSP